MNPKSTVSNLKRLFYIVFFIQVAFFISLAFKWINIASYVAEIPIALERYALLITLLGIPGALKLFSVIMEKSKNSDDSNFITSQYKKAFIARFGILFLVASLNIILYGFSFNQNFMLLTLITFTAYIFCYPSMGYLNTDNVETEQKDTKE